MACGLSALADDGSMMNEDMLARATRDTDGSEFICQAQHSQHSGPKGLLLMDAAR